jgi:hypothetical protein
VEARGEYQIDYGQDTRFNKVGTYSVSWFWSTRTVAAWENGRLALLGPRVVKGFFTETQNVFDVLLDENGNPTRRVPEQCTPFETSTPDDAWAEVSPPSRNRFAHVPGAARLVVTPGVRMSAWEPRCAQVDGAGSHGLNAYPSQTVTTIKPGGGTIFNPGGAIYIFGKRNFGIDCWRTASVKDPNPTPHVFTGEVEIAVRRVPLRPARQAGSERGQAPRQEIGLHRHRIHRPEREGGAGQGRSKSSCSAGRF